MISRLRALGVRRTALALGIVLAALVASSASAQHLRIYYPDIEQGSATLVVSPTGKAMLIDAGTGIKEAEDGVEHFINDLIDAGVVTSLDYTVATHYDEDHIGRMENVYQKVPLAPGAIAYDRGAFGSTPSTFAYSDYSFGASLHNRTTGTVCSVIDLGGGVTAKFITVNGEVCGASTVDLSTSSQFENAASLTVLVEYGDVDVWIGGDLTGNPDFGVADVESEASSPVSDVDVYTLNHHGSRTSSNATFLGLLKAEVGINQNSASNNHGHPNSIVVNRFLGTLDTAGNAPVFYQQNPGNATDTRSDDSLATGIADCDDVDGAFGLPGTMLLIADATSYRLHACNIAATTFAADEGLGTLGDFPPAIRSVLHTPRVPLATESVTLEADLEDVASAEIRYSLDGVTQTPVAMTLQSGITWSGTLPAQLDGVQVEYRIAATDSSAQTELSPEGCYFSGITPIGTLRQNDSSGVLIPVNCGVRIEGNLTVEPGILHPFVTQAFVQDGTGGVQVFDTSIPALSRGDLVQYVGAAEQFSGMTEVNAAEDFGNFGHTFIASGTAPAPQVITVSQVGEAFEGQLVRLNGVSISDGSLLPESGNGTLEISDDGGVTVTDLRIDGDTDIPGANTPTQSFDVVGVVSQFDSWVGYTSGYQIVPRERTDLVTDEVNHPVVLISEIHADPASGLTGDANGDGSRSATQDEFIELINTGYSSFDLSGYTLEDGVGLRHTFPANTVVPAREAVVVFGGGTPTGDFGNATANGLVFTASTGSLGLNNSGDTVTLKDDLGAVVQAVTYNGAGGDNQSLVRDPDFSNAPMVKHSVATGSNGLLYSPGTRIDGQAYTVQQGSLILTEVLYDPSGSDNGLEWFELHNTTSATIALDGLCVGNGGSDYTSSLVPLDGLSVSAGGTVVIGGATSSPDNGSPTFDLVIDFTPDFQNSGSTADGVALFNVGCAQVGNGVVPIDAVVYGGSNVNNLIDETGVANAPEVADVSGGWSIERVDVAGVWQAQAVPTPGAFTDGGPPPPPGGLILSEVFYDASSSDNGYEWVELYNSGTQTIDLSAFSLGNGGTTYTSSKVQLSGTVAPGATFVVGGPTSDGTNGNPTYDLVINFSPDLQNSGSVGDGVALFDVPAVAVTGTTVPIDAVVYGPNNNNNLIDETGVASAPEVGDAPGGSSIERTDLAGSWQIQGSPTPNSTGL